jgi:Kef-type K+ transport system membrane component KefB
MQILGLWAFLTLAWLLGSIFSRWHLALIGELIAGALLGPGLCDVVPFAQAWTLLGELSLCFLVFDGALSLDLTKLRLVGLRAMTIAFAGVVLPVALAFGILQAFALPALTSLAAGVSLASTAIGSTAVLLKSHGLQETEMGWMIASAAIIDDVGSLVLLAIVGRLGPGSVDGSSGSLFFPATTNLGLIAISPILASIIVALVAYILSRTFFPFVFLRLSALEEPPAIDRPPLQLTVVSTLSPAIVGHPKSPGIKQRDWMLYLFALACTTGLAVLSNYLGTSILFGVFLSASCLTSSLRPTPVRADVETSSIALVDISSNIPSPSIPGPEPEFNITNIHAHFTEVLSPISARLFFGSTGLTVPTMVLFRPGALLMGLCLTLAGALGKWMTGTLFEREWTRVHIVGFSMVSRGDLGFLLARTAQQKGLLDDESYAAVVWALLLCTCLGPLVVSRILQKQQ